MLSFGNQTFRKVFFPTNDQMQYAVYQLLELQGFVERSDQYEMVKDLEPGIMCKRSIVQHKLTKQKFEMRQFETIDAEQNSISIFDCERQARQKINSERHVDTLIDVFSNDTHQFMIVGQKINARVSLTSVVEKY